MSNNYIVLMLVVIFVTIRFASQSLMVKSVM